MITLHLGVMEIGYSDASGATTTGDVATILEDKYHVMRTFVELREEKIGDALAESMSNAIANLANGLPPSKNPAQGAEQKIETMFRDFLDADEMSGIFPKTQQIAAAQKGISHRKKHPYRKSNPRPAFIDTGLYQSSFRAWIGEK